MKKSRRVMLFVSAMLVGVSARGADQAKITIKTVDDEGKPLAEMPVSASFYQAYSAKGESDTNGLFVLEGDAKMGEANYFAQKEGYYRTEGRYTFSPAWSPQGGRFKPWNPVVTAVVRRVVNPVPMYVKKVETKTPVLDEPVGFDLVQGDWVAPHGKGKVTDFAFEMKKRYIGFTNFDASFDLTVTNVLDGLQETSLKVFESSQFRLLRNAPIVGYGTRAFHIADSSTNYFKPDKDQSFYFRVRTVTNETGQITSALYGKIRGYIGFDVTRVKTGQMHFTYYLNPTPNDRNLEFDPKRNLFTNLKSTEQVTAP